MRVAATHEGRLPVLGLRDGEGFVILAGIVHKAKNDGASAVRLVGVYVVEKGKPLASPASAPAP